MALAYSYQRFSSAAQSTGDSLRRQNKYLAKWLEANPDVKLDLTLTDAGVSALRGDNRTRGALAQFLKLIEEGRVARGSYLLVENLDRLSRETEMVAMSLLTSICAAGVKVVTLIDNAVYDEKSRGHDISRAVHIMSRAHDESLIKSERGREIWSEKKRRAREEGVPTTSRCPHWLRLDRSTGKFEIIEEEAEKVRGIFESYVSGIGTTTIVRNINAAYVEAGVKRRISTKLVTNILKTPRVIGHYQPESFEKAGGGLTDRKPDGDLIENYYPRIISDETFYRAQKIILNNGQPKGRKGRTFVNTIATLGRCEHCSNRLLVASNRLEHHRGMICAGYREREGCENGHRYELGEIESFLFTAIIQGKAKVAIDAALHKSTLPRLASITGQIASLNAKIENLLDALEDGEETAKPRLAKRRAELATLKAEEIKLKAEAGSVGPTHAKELSDAAKWFRRADHLAKLVTTGKSEHEPELVSIRGKINAILIDLFDWIVPVYSGPRRRAVKKVDGVFAANGSRVFWFTRDDTGDIVFADFEIDEPTTEPTSTVLFRLLEERGQFKPIG